MIIEIKNGTFAYDKTQKPVLKNVNLTAGSGDVVAILGHNGAGKTTMLRCLMGLLKWNEGESLIDGKNIRDISHKTLWQLVAYVPQAKKTTAAFTIEEMILLGRSSRLGIFSQPKKEDLEKVNRIIERLGIGFLKGKKCSQISGGELQMVLIAKALASEPKVLILDEPESNLDFKNQLVVLDTMSELAAEGMTCIFNTHYPAHALQRANKAFMLKGGGEYLFGDTHEIVTEKNIKYVFGVDAVIGDIEAPGNIFKDVIPVNVVKNENNEELTLECGIDSDENVLAVLAIIIPNSNITSQINKLLHENSQYIIGRMGMPYHKEDVFIINVTFDAPVNVVRKITDSLNMLPNVSVKATYAKNFSKK